MKILFQFLFMYIFLLILSNQYECGLIDIMDQYAVLGSLSRWCRLFLLYYEIGNENYIALGKKKKMCIFCHSI